MKPRRPNVRPGALQLFLGPMSHEYDLASGELVMISMLLVSADNPAGIRLAYPTYLEARKQRRLLLKAGNIETVPGLSLLAALQRGLGEAKKLGTTPAVPVAVETG